MKRICFSLLMSTFSFGYAANFSSYVGGFGGFSGPKNINATQSGSAYHFVGDLFPGESTPTTENFELLVNVAGNPKIQTGGLVGMHAGLITKPIVFESKGFSFTPIMELEGFYLGSKLSGSFANPQLEPAVLLSNGSVYSARSTSAYRHQFENSFNMNAGFLLFNSLFDFSLDSQSIVQPYAGVGLGFAFNHLTGAQSDQLSPYHEDVNHFNSGNSAWDTMFAAQTKLGIHTKYYHQISFFMEYRYLYAAASSYTFGSTNYPGYHAQTSKWQVDLSSMNFQMGVLGIHYLFA